MTRAVFVVSKQPFGTIQDGETTVTRVLLDAAAETCSVKVVALAEGPATDAPVEVIEVPKPPVRIGRLALASALRNRSLVHLRFAPDSLRETLASVPADVLVARRLYMAQAAIDAGRMPPRDRLLALVDVLESTVMRLRRSAFGPLYAIESRRTRRDEVRCLRAASEVAYFSDTELGELDDHASGAPRRLDLVLPSPIRPAPLEDPVAVFVGDRRWPPNSEALERLLALWPRIAAATPRARLLIIGHPGPGERQPRASNIEWRGFVDDLADVWRRAGVLLAPISIGGGVRVKVLDAARHGVPVVGTSEAIGSVGDYLPVSARASDEDFVADAGTLLADAAERCRRGEALFEVNRELNAQGFVEGQVAELLVPDRAVEP